MKFMGSLWLRVSPEGASNRDGEKCEHAKSSGTEPAEVIPVPIIRAGSSAPGGEPRGGALKGCFHRNAQAAQDGAR